MLTDTAQRETDLLQAHQLLMAGLMAETGRYRSSGVGVMSGNQVVHMALLMAI